MTDRVILVTPPDDIHIDGVRVLLVELDTEQSQLVSNALLQLDNLKLPVVTYVWKMGDSVEWLLDKRVKSDIIIFNADITNNGAIELIIGYISAQPGSYYFGTLRDLHLANPRVLYTSEDILNLLETTLAKHGIR